MICSFNKLFLLRSHLGAYPPVGRIDGSLRLDLCDSLAIAGNCPQPHAPTLNICNQPYLVYDDPAPYLKISGSATIGIGSRNLARSGNQVTIPDRHRSSYLVCKPRMGFADRVFYLHR